MYFYSRPCGRGDAPSIVIQSTGPHFYSRPCGRGDERRRDGEDDLWEISTHAPAGGATGAEYQGKTGEELFLLTPLREGRLLCFLIASTVVSLFLLTPLREGRQKLATVSMYSFAISTHAPAGGAT